MVRPDALLFDMDGLLLDTERIAQETFADLAPAYGMPRATAQAFFLTLVGTSNSVTRQRLAAALPDADLDAIDRDWRAGMQARLGNGVPLMPGVADGVADLSAQGLRMAVVTSTGGARARQHLECAGLAKYFEHVTGGDEVSANKPDPAPYRETAAILGVNPRHCVAFEDSDRGITAACRAGCRSVQIPDLRPAETPLPALGQIVARDFPTALRALGLL